MRIFILIAVLSSLAFSASKATKPYTFTPHTTSSADQVNKNFDSLYVPFNKAIDTLNKVVPRWSSLLYQKDSTWKYMNIDTIAGKVKMDTITDLDSIYSDQAKFKNVWVESDSNSHITINESDTGQCPYLYLRIANANNKKIPRIVFSNNGLDFITASNYCPLRMKRDSLWIKGDFYDTGMVACSNVLTNYIQFGTAAASKFSTYADTTFPDSLYDGTTYRAAGTGHIIQIGNQITFNTTTLTGNMAATNFTYLKGIPSKFYPSTSQYFKIIIESNSAFAEGVFYFYVTDGTFKIYLVNAGSLDVLATGTGGIYSTTLSWIK